MLTLYYKFYSENQWFVFKNYLGQIRSMGGGGGRTWKRMNKHTSKQTVTKKFLKKNRGGTSRVGVEIFKRPY